MRALARTIFKLFLSISPERVRYRAANLPFSRFHSWIPVLFKGNIKFTYRNVLLFVNPGETVGYHPYFFGSNPKDEVALLVQACQGVNTFVDIGANIGLVSLPLAKALPHLKVFSFEPDPLIAAKFKANLELNPELSSRVHLIEKAVSNKDGTLSFHSDANTANEGTGRIMEGAGLEVKTTRLDNFFLPDRTPDVIKMDIEGAELQAIQGMQRWPSEALPQLLLIEVHGFYFGDDAATHNKQVADELSKAGYRIERLIDGKSIDAGDPAKWPTRLHILAKRTKYLTRNTNID